MNTIECVIRDGFAFAPLINDGICDALIVRETLDATCVYEPYSIGSRTLEECIEYINSHNLESAIIIANDLSFLNKCPSIKHFVFYLNLGNLQMPKMSYLSMLPGVRSFRVGGFEGVDELYTGGRSSLVFQKLKTLKNLNMWGINDKLDSKENSKERITTIEDFDLPELLKLSLLQCNITSLKGIQNCPKLQWLDMTYMRSLTDISDLISLAPTLRMLSIQSCPKITDFSVISNLKELEYLELHGKNELPNLDFIKELPKLKLVNLSMNVIDGDISCLQNIQYADVVCKRHYNLKNKDLSKYRTDLGFKFI